ncbi:hypothetical protein [Novacetimonas hansenii]|uniref:Uncharacterized protein n=1 Tax=Novacetimonas hansenii TaxID=436 RepID=A0AAW5ESM7_NOVHA|nr:hypothetical protein [Novacetimonas hansenii]MBL7236280.1 hypothetical protein [Novacetimonas hansenii]MCJ8353863.1 hypothetical protein [Novacetimonas hansenii]WEQ57902.1 hypothetical protein LV563_08315 [Novacetimonas hansenii]
MRNHHGRRRAASRPPRHGAPAMTARAAGGPRPTATLIQPAREAGT